MPGTRQFNPTMLALLIVVAAILAGVLILRDPVDPIPDPKIEPVEERIDSVEIDGVLTEELPEFDVQIDAKLVGQQQRLEFTISELHGWAVRYVYVRAHFGEVDPDTGEFVRRAEFPVEMLCRDHLEFGKPLICETTLTTFELEHIGGNIGGPENWEGVVYDWRQGLQAPTPVAARRHRRISRSPLPAVEPRANPGQHPDNPPERRARMLLRQNLRDRETAAITAKRNKTGILSQLVAEEHHARTAAAVEIDLTEGQRPIGLLIEFQPPGED